MNDEMISRKTLMDKLKLAVIITDDLYGMGIMEGIKHAKECVEEAPTIDAVPVVHGRWVEKFFTNDRQRVCSVCHSTVRQPSYDRGEIKFFNYCPNCGARMDG